jgi:hypothetical protein
MAKQSKTRRYRREDVKQQDVFEFGPSIEPAARPVDYDTRVTPKNVKGGAAEALLRGLGLLEDTVPAAVQIMENTKKEHTEQGKLAAARGDKLNEDATEAFIEGYEQMKGAGEGYLELQSVLQKHYDENVGQDPASFSASQDIAIKNFFLGRSDNYIKGALPGAISLQKEYANDYTKKKAAEFQADLLATNRNHMDANITKIIKEQPENLSKELRVELNRQQENMKMQGFHRSVSSAGMVNIMGDKAVQQGNRELMKFAYEKGPDGIRVIDNAKLAEKVQAYEEAADREARRKVTQAREDRERREKDALSDITSNLSQYASAMSDPQVKPEQRKQLAIEFDKLLHSVSDRNNNPAGLELTAKQIEHYKKMQDNITGLNDNMFANQSVAEVEARARQMARQQPHLLTPDQMNALVPFLSKDDYVSIIDLKAQSQESLRKTGHKKSERERRWDESFKLARDVVSKKNSMGEPMFERGPERERKYVKLVNAKLDQFRKENKGAWPDDDQAEKIMDDVMKYLNKDPMLGLDDMGMPLGSVVSGIQKGASTTASAGPKQPGMGRTDTNVKDRFNNLKTNNDKNTTSPLVNEAAEGDQD